MRTACSERLHYIPISNRAEPNQDRSTEFSEKFNLIVNFCSVVKASAVNSLMHGIKLFLQNHPFRAFARKGSTLNQIKASRTEWTKLRQSLINFLTRKQNTAARKSFHSTLKSFPPSRGRLSCKLFIVSQFSMFTCVLEHILFHFN